MTFSAEMQDVVNELVEEFGQPCVVRISTNTGQEWAPVVEDVDHDVYGVDLSVKILKTPNRAGSTRVRALVLRTKEGVVPSIGDKVAIGVIKANVTSSTAFSVIEEIRVERPAGVDIVYELELAVDG